MFTITVKSRTYRYDTLASALRVADEIFNATGVIVGINHT